MSDRKRHSLNKIYKYPGPFTNKAIELPQYISPENLHTIITRGCKSTNHIKRFKLDSPSPSQEARIRPDRISEPPSKYDDSYLKRGESRNNQNLGKKILNLKSKNAELKESLKLLENKYKGQISGLKRENEKMITNMKIVKKEHAEEKSKLGETIFHLDQDLSYYKNNFEKFVISMYQIIEGKSQSVQVLKDEFNKVLQEKLSFLSPRMTNFIFVEPVEFVSTGQFKSVGNFSDSIGSCKVHTKEAIAMKKYKAQVHGELDLNLGDRVTILKCDDEHIWLGKIREKVGLFPSSYVMLD